MNKAGIIFQKDFTDFLRDKKHCLLTIFGPLFLYPILFISLGYVFSTEHAKQDLHIYKVGIVRLSEFPSALMKLLKEDKRIHIHSASRNDSLLYNLDVSLTVDQLSSVERIDIRYKGAVTESRNALQIIETMIMKYRDCLIREQLALCQQDTFMLCPFTVSRINISSEKRMGGYLLGLLIPYLLFIICYSAAITVSCDITAGEKERKTLETLLVTDIRKGDIVIGKILTTFTVSFISGISGFTGLLISFITGLSILSLDETAVHVSVPWTACILIFIVMWPFLWFCSSLLVAIGSYAKNIKEAQNYCVYTFFLGMVPGVMSVSRLTSPDTYQFFIPVLNTALLQQQILAGALNYFHCGVTLGVNIVYAGLVYFVAKRCFRKETVLFRV